MQILNADSEKNTKQGGEGVSRLGGSSVPKGKDKNRY